MSQKINILIAGGETRLGAEAIKFCLKRSNLEVTALLRNPDECEELKKLIEESNNGKIIKGDLSKADTIKDCTKGIHTVVAALKDDENIIDLQETLLEDAKKNDVKRFVPSEFCVNLDQVEESDHPILFKKLQFRKKIDESGIDRLSILTGIFLDDFFFIFKDGFYYYENRDQKFDLTSFEDAGKFIAEAISKTDRTGEMRLVSFELTMSELLGIYNQVLDKHVVAKNDGTFEEALQKIDKNIKDKDSRQGILESFILMVFDGRAKLKDLHNKNIKALPTTSFENWIGDNVDRATDIKENWSNFKMGQANWVSEG